MKYRSVQLMHNHQENAAGGTLELEMGPEPNMQWGVE